MKKTAMKNLGIALTLSGGLLLAISYFLMLQQGRAPGLEILNRTGTSTLGLGLFLWISRGNIVLWRMQPPATRIPGLEVENEELDQIYQETMAEEFDERGDLLNARACRAALWVMGICIWVCGEISAALSAAGFYRPWSTWAMCVFFALGLLTLISFSIAKKYWDKRM